MVGPGEGEIFEICPKPKPIKRSLSVFLPGVVGQTETQFEQGAGEVVIECLRAGHAEVDCLNNV